MFESSGEALLLTDSTGTIHQANPRARHLLELRESNPRGISLGMVLAEQSGESLLLLCDAANPSKRSIVDAALVTGQHIRIALRAVLADSRDLLLCLEREPSVERSSPVQQLQAELRSVLDSASTGMILYDPAGNVRFCNARFAQMFGIEAQELERLKTADDVGSALRPLLRDAKPFAEVRKRFAEGDKQPVRDEAELLTPRHRVIERSARPVLDGEGRAGGWLEVYSDITGEREIQAKMFQTEKMAAVGQLVSGIAHELNNPLTTIVGYAQLLLAHELKPGQLEQATKVYQQAERARQIVKNLLYFGRESEPQRRPADINEVIERTLALRSYELRIENIRVTCHLAPDLPRTLADPYQLQQVILNLLMNAEQALVEARGQGHVTIRTRRLPMAKGLLQVPGHAERIEIEVADDGPGIDPQVASRIFDPFFTTKPQGVGTGLGLSIVYGIVQQHGGEVTFESRPGRGARFRIELPVVAAHFAAAADTPPAQTDAAGVAAQGCILVIEDEPTIAQLVMDVLEEEGHKVEAVLDSKEALNRVARRNYDLLICDLRMPGLDGPTFYESLAQAGSPMRNRLLFMTGDTLGPRTLEFLKPRKLRYLAKPFLVEELKLAVREMLQAGGKDGDPQEMSGSGRHDRRSQ